MKNQLNFFAKSPFLLTMASGMLVLVVFLLNFPVAPVSDESTNFVAQAAKQNNNEIFQNVEEYLSTRSPSDIGTYTFYADCFEG